MRFFTSDMHFHHRNIMEYCPGRPGESAEDMSEVLIDNWNRTVGPDDEVWVLGDVAMGRIDESLPLVGRLNGRKRLVAGNHDRCWSPLGPKAAKWRQRYLDVGFELIVEEAVIDVPELGAVTLCHFPFEGDSHDEDRYVDQRPADYGQWLFHGHVHDAWKIKGRQINVGVDVWDYTPVSLDQMVDLARVSLAGLSS